MTRALPKLQSLLLPLLAVLILGACAKSEPPASPAPVSSANDSASPLPSEIASNSAVVIDTTSAEAKAAELTQVVRRYAAEKQRAPKSLDEIAAAGYLPSVPEAPAGKKFAIDKNLQVYLADQ